MALLYFIAMLSGFAALVYQMLWIRELALVLGSTTAAISTVVAAFMGGLALGSGLIGRWADRRGNFLRIYAALEVGIAVSAYALQFAFPWLESVYPQLAIAASDSPGWLAVLRFLVAFTLLLVPTSLMGGTFPVLVRALTREIHSLGATVGRMYAANTLGAVAGCMVSGIWMIGSLGVSGAYWVAVVLNLVAAVATFALAALAVRRGTPPPAVVVGNGDMKNNSIAVPDAAARAVAWAIGVSGAIALGYEIVWSRALAIVLGHSIYAFTFVLGTYLAGLALGGALVAHWLDRWKSPARVFALGLLALGAISGASLFLVPWLPFQTYSLRLPPLEYILGNLACTAALVLAPTMILGALLPLAMRVCAGGLERAGADVGRIYAWNTLGAIAGSLLTGFALIPGIGTQRTFVLFVAANFALAIIVGLRARWTMVWKATSALLLALAVAGFFASKDSPILRSKALARVERQVGGDVTLRFWGEDQVASVGLIRGKDGMERLFANGVLMTHWGLETLWMAHLPLAMVEQPRDVLVLCLGMGNTYRAAALHPVRVTAVELSPKIVEAYFVMHGKKSDLQSDDRIQVGDARNAVLVSDQQYDVITVDPPPPLYSAGTVSFHTVEFFELLRARLRPNGVVCQWIPFYDCTIDECKSIMRSFGTVFPRRWVWAPSATTGMSGVYLIGLGPEASINVEAVRQRLGSGLVAKDVRRFIAGPIEASFPVALLRGEELDEFCGEVDLLDDAHPFLEFPLFRNAGRTDLMNAKPLTDFIDSPARRR